MNKDEISIRYSFLPEDDRVVFGIVNEEFRHLPTCMVNLDPGEWLQVFILGNTKDVGMNPDDCRAMAVLFETLAESLEEAIRQRREGDQNERSR